MRDGHGRVVDYLRVSVTDRCNFRCVYCMPPEGVTQLGHPDILTYEEIVRIIAIASRYCGIKRVRLTGGEPLVRKDIINLVQAISDLGTIADLSLTTNGSLLATQAGNLKHAGLNRVNISLDTFNASRYYDITRGGNIKAVLDGIQSALKANLTPLKVNAVLTRALTAGDIRQFFHFACQNGVIVRFIEYMPIGYNGIDEGLTIEQVKTMLSGFSGGKLVPRSGVKGAGPARYYTAAGTQAVFGFITPVSEHFCTACNRIRVTADGRIKPCLLSDREINIKTALRSGVDDAYIGALLSQAIAQKPTGHLLTSLEKQGIIKRHMCQIGG